MFGLEDELQEEIEILKKENKQLKEENKLYDEVVEGLRKNIMERDFRIGEAIRILKD